MDSCLKTKSEESIKSAEILISKGLFNACIHCSYYACVQLMIHILYSEFEMSDAVIREEQKEVSEELEGGFHAWLINKFYFELIRKKTEKYEEFNDTITELKKARTTADYKNISIKVEKAKKCQKYCTQVIEILNTNFKI